MHKLYILHKYYLVFPYKPLTLITLIINYLINSFKEFLIFCLAF